LTGVLRTDVKQDVHHDRTNEMPHRVGRSVTLHPLTSTPSHSPLHNNLIPPGTPIAFLNKIELKLAWKPPQPIPSGLVRKAPDGAEGDADDDCGEDELLGWDDEEKVGGDDYEDGLLLDELYVMEEGQYRFSMIL
jgi:hypothetical protein